MTPTITQNPLRAFVERLAFLMPACEAPALTRDPDDEPGGEDQDFADRDEAFYWGWSRNAFL